MATLADLEAELVVANETTNAISVKLGEIGNDVDDLVSRLSGSPTQEDIDKAVELAKSLKEKLSVQATVAEEVAAKHTPTT